MTDLFFYGTLCHAPLLAAVLGREVATPSEARAMLGLKGRDKVKISRFTTARRNWQMSPLCGTWCRHCRTMMAAQAPWGQRPP